MRLMIDDNEYWIKDVELPSDFNSMNEYKKVDYIWNNTLLHRENDLPAFITNGVKSWWINGKRNRLDGPAIINSDMYQAWYLNGKRHRLNGPAIIGFYGIKHWYLNGIPVDGEIYQKIQNSSKEELLVYMIDSKYKKYLPLIEYRLNQ